MSIEQVAFIQISDLHIGGRMLDNRFSAVPLYSAKNEHAGPLLEPLRRAILDATAGVRVARAIICHHPFFKQAGLLDAWPLRPASISELLQSAERHRVHAILTGHNHSFFAKSWPCTS